MQKINNIVKFVKASYYRLRNIEKLENKIHNFCDKEEKRIEDLIEMAKRKANDYKIHIAESIKTKEELIDKLKDEEEELIKTIKITTAEKVKAIKSEIDVLKIRKNRQ